MQTCVPCVSRLVAAAALALLLPACAVSPADATDPTGAIYETASGRRLTEAELVARLRAARYRLLGEMHDNAEHHAVRARLIAAIAAGDRRPAVVAELFDLEHEPALMRAQSNPALDAEALATAGGLDRRAWAWPLHKPVLDAAIGARLPVHAGNVSRVDLQRAVRTGEAPAAAASWNERLKTAAWSPAQDATLRASIEGGHCGTLPAELVPRIAQAQRLRDAAMAQALVDAAAGDGAILVAGNGHVRRDIGVPAYLGAERAAATVSVGLIEASDAERAALQLPAADASALRAYDYVWLTTTAERADPCAQLRSSPPK